MTYTPEEIAEILRKHALWATGESRGEPADLSDANLSGANLSEADLRWANLSEANLSEADLRGADLSEADLYAADFSRANLRGADLSEADLRGADLSEADLSEANLRGADLSEADLRRANLSGANLSGANLSEADLRRANITGAKGIYLLPVQDPRGYSWPHAILCSGGQWRIRAGCRFFTIPEARAHWGETYKGNRRTGDMYLAAVDWLEKVIAEDYADAEE